MKTTKLSISTLTKPFVICLFSLSACTSVMSNEPKYQTLVTDDGQAFETYVSGPENSKKAILFIHGWLGLDNVVKKSTYEYAKLGYRTMAIDLFNGKTADNPKDAKALVMKANKEGTSMKLHAALKNLSSSNTRKVGVLGWSFGGGQAIHATFVAPQFISATVSYYPSGKVPLDQPTIAKLSSPILIQASEGDLTSDKVFRLTKEKAENFKAAMKQANKSLTLNIYKAKHGFNRAASKNYNPEAKKLANSSTQAFFKENL